MFLTPSRINKAGFRTGALTPAEEATQRKLRIAIATGCLLLLLIAGHQLFGYGTALSYGMQVLADGFMCLAWLGMFFIQNAAADFSNETGLMVGFGRYGRIGRPEDHKVFEASRFWRGVRLGRILLLIDAVWLGLPVSLLLFAVMASHGHN